MLRINIEKAAFIFSFLLVLERVFIGKAIADTTISTPTTSTYTSTDNNDVLNINFGGDIAVSGGYRAVNVYQYSNWTININTNSNKGISSDSGDAIGSSLPDQEYIYGTLNLISGRVSSNANAINLKIVDFNYFAESFINTSAGTSISAVDTAIKFFGGRILTINNAGTITGATAIEVENTELEVNNSGIINGNINVISDDEAVITNSGTIVGNIDLGLNSGSSFTQSAGSTTGDITIQNDSQTINLNGGSLTGEIDGLASSLGTIKVNGNVTLGASSALGSNNGITSLNILSGGNLTLGSDSIINASNITLAGTLNLGNSNKNITGNLTGGGSSTLNLGSGSHSLNGNAVINSGDTVAVTLLSSGNIGNLTSSGTLTVNEGASITASLPEDYNYIANGTKYKILSGEAGSSINTISDINLSREFILLNFTTSVQDDALYLDASRTAASEVTDNGNSQRVYDTINNVGNSSTVELRDFQRYLDQSSSLDQIGSALNSVLPQYDNGLSRNNINSTYGSIRTIENHLDSSRIIPFKKSQEFTKIEEPVKIFDSVEVSEPAKIIEHKEEENDITAVIDKVNPFRNAKKPITKKFRLKKGISTGQEQKIRPSLIPSKERVKPTQKFKFIRGISSGDESVNKGIWGQVFGNTSKQNITDGGDGYKSQSSGVAFGYDQKISNDSTVGFNLSYAASEVKSSDSLKKTTVDTYQVNLYHGKNFNEYFLDTIVGFAWNEYNSNRSIPVIGVNAKANYSGQTYVSKVRSGLVKDVGLGFILIPEISLNYLHNRNNAYSETGAGTIGLKVYGNSSSFLEGRAGLTLKHNSVTAKGTVISPEILASYGYDFIGDRQSINSSFIGQTATFNVISPKIDRKSLRVGAGLSILEKNDVNINVNYLFETKSEFQSHSGWLKLEYGF